METVWPALIVRLSGFVKVTPVRSAEAATVIALLPALIALGISDVLFGSVASPLSVSVPSTTERLSAVKSPLAVVTFNVPLFVTVPPASKAVSCASVSVAVWPALIVRLSGFVKVTPVRSAEAATVIALLPALIAPGISDVLFGSVASPLSVSCVG